MEQLNVDVRFGKKADAAWCQNTLTIDENVLARKIEGHEIIVAEKQNDLVGVLEFVYLWAGHDWDAPYITGIIVMNAYQRRGVGRAMLGFIEDHLRNSGFAFLLSSCVLNELPPQDWHRHMGFEECGILSGVNDGGVGEVFFRKQLTT